MILNVQQYDTVFIHITDFKACHWCTLLPSKITGQMNQI